MSLDLYLTNKADFIEKQLEKALPANDIYPSIIHEAMRYSVLGGGKRLRAILALAACEVFSGSFEQAIGFACALEMIHAYTLVHDDLPCMDDDDYRRGKLTTHKVFGEGIAVLAGDALLTLAFEELAKMPEKYQVSTEVTIQLIKEVSEAIGSQGVIGGQVVDLDSEGKSIDSNVLEYIHHHKTGKLFIASLKGGALIGGANEEQLKAVVDFGTYFGLAFQITDDVLDLTGDATRLGKPVGSDTEQGKNTYPSIFGLENAQEMAKECILNCHQAVTSLPKTASILGDIADFILNRDH
ncbi:MAG: polyprenyl synthetase family protein [Firmicutes bacterium]|nr:polyprenyl synthetase family protein [Bacillota bacterium]